MLGLGKEVLSKIENLLVEIDRKKEKKHDKEQKEKTPRKEKSKPKYNNESLKKSKYHQKSLNDEEEKENICSSRIEQLYLNHFIREKKLLDKNLSMMEDEMKEIKNFKVENKISQFMNRKKSLKPIYERTNEVLLKKEKSIEKIKETAPKNQKQIEEEESHRIMEEKKKKYPKLTKEEFDKRMEELQKRNIKRLEKIQKKKLEELEHRSSLYLEKPDLHPVNQAWWEKKKLKKNLSNNVFERFSQYDMERKEKWEKYLEKRKKEETPFTPRISEVTREIARKSQSRRSLFDNMSRSMSCNTLSKCHELISLEKKEEPSMERSLSKSRTFKHGKSATTMYSSRQALIEKRGD